jgi:predicted ABC-type transport system involved in lysophospholipase L1 biosynthesis ATPase subunit
MSLKASCTTTLHGPGLRGCSVTDLLEMSNVSKLYWRGERLLPVLMDISLEVHQCEVVAVVGARDEGKTTLLKIAAGMERADKGRVILAGRDLATLSGNDRERLLGAQVVWIDRERPGMRWKARDYVSLPLAMGREHSLRRARASAVAALERVGAAGCACQRWGDLSNWERMLVGLARAVVGRPRLILIDDLLDGFGMLRTQEVGDLLCPLVQELDCGVLMSSSGLEATLVADTVLSFGCGRLTPLAGCAGDGAQVIDFPAGVHPSTSTRGVGS